MTDTNARDITPEDLPKASNGRAMVLPMANSFLEPPNEHLERPMDVYLFNDGSEGEGCLGVVQNGPWVAVAVENGEWISGELVYTPGETLTLRRVHDSDKVTGEDGTERTMVRFLDTSISMERVVTWSSLEGVVWSNEEEEEPDTTAGGIDPITGFPKRSR